MVSDIVLGSLIGGGFSVVGYIAAGLINHASTKRRIEADKDRLRIRQDNENERRRAEFFLGEKVDALTTLYRDLEKAKRCYLSRGDEAENNPISEDVVSEVLSAYRSFEESMDYASLFLDEDQYETVMAFFVELMDANSMFQWWVNNPNAGYSDIPDRRTWDRGEFLRTYDDAREALKDEVAEPIRQFESE